MSSSKKLIASAGKPYGHVPGHTFRDVEIYAHKRGFLLELSWGSAQGRGCDEVHGSREYAAETLDELRRTALAEESDDDWRKYVHTAVARAIAGDE